MGPPSAFPVKGVDYADVSYCVFSDLVPNPLGVPVRGVVEVPLVEVVRRAEVP